MTRIEYHAWFNLVIYILGLTGLAALWPWLHSGAFIAFAIWGAIPLGSLFYIPWPGTSRPIFDERDAAIVRRSKLITTQVFWWTAAGGCWLPFLICGFSGKIPAVVVSLYSLGAGLLWLLLFSLCIILQGRKDRHAPPA